MKTSIVFIDRESASALLRLAHVKVSDPATSTADELFDIRELLERHFFEWIRTRNHQRLLIAFDELRQNLESMKNPKTSMKPAANRVTLSK